MERLTGRIGLCLAGCVAMLTSLAGVPRVWSVLANADWETVAGGKMSFDVASVKKNPPHPMRGAFANPSLPLDGSDRYPGKTTLFSANVPLAVYISFAYKLPTYQYELDAVTSQLPKWAATQRFDIQARAASPSTKDQMRLMMQSLLADRFDLAVHWQAQQLSAFDLVLVKQGKTGPQLQPHSERIPCQYYSPGMSREDEMATLPGGLPVLCNLPIGGSGPRGGQEAARNMTMAQFADLMSGVFGRPIIDKTGLVGGFDISVSFKLDLSPSEIGSFGLGDIQSGFVRALRDQLGLKLEASKTSVKALIIDHVEEPSSN